MEMELQVSNVSSPCVYVTAPTSPNAYSRSHSRELFYSAPVSPRRRIGNNTVYGCDGKEDPISNLDDFEFETSKKFSGQLQFDETSPNFDSRNGDDQECQAKQKCRERGDSLPAMAFADELFHNGLVMPLKLPPRLQYDSDFNSFSQKSPSSSPKSPRIMCKLPFARKNAWNDDFDPFMVALQKVREEKRGRNSNHRRSRSYSPFRIAHSKFFSETLGCNQDLYKENAPIKPMQVPTSSYSGPLELKGSAYARWVRDQTKEGMNQRGPKSPRGFLFGQRVRPVKIDHDDQEKPTSTKGKEINEKGGNVNGESKVRKLKGLFLRYASFGRGKSGSKLTKKSSGLQKPSYFSRLSFKFKETALGNGKKSIPADKNMAVVEYKPPVTLCLGPGIGSPSNFN